MPQDIYENLFFMCNTALDEGKHFFWTNVIQCSLDHPLLDIFFVYLLIRWILAEVKKIQRMFRY